MEETLYCKSLIFNFESNVHKTFKAMKPATKDEVVALLMKNDPDATPHEIQEV